MNKIGVKKIVMIFTIVVCSIVIVLPLVMINTNPDKISVTENRGLAQRPSLFENGGFNTEFVKKFEAYIDDNIGFKQEAIVLKIDVLYRLFDKLDIPNYYMGSNENLYYSNGMDGIHNYQGIVEYSEVETKRIIESINNWSSWTRNSGAEFMFMPIPDKEGIYPEDYPKSVLRKKGKTKIDILRENMENSGIDYIINVKEALLLHKNDEMLYYKNFDPTHWNMHGAWVGYSILMDKITSSNDDIKPLAINDINIEIKKSPGTLQHLSQINSLCQSMHFDDDIMSYVPKSGYRAVLEEELPEWLELSANQIFYHYKNVTVQNDKTLFIVGDSYTYMFLLPLLAESFRDVYFISLDTGEQLTEIQDRINPDIVVFEFVERAFSYEYMIPELERIGK